MQYKIITIPFNKEKEIFEEEILNSFAINKKIIKSKAKFFVQEGKAYWVLYFEYKTILDNGVVSNTKSITTTDAKANFTEAEKVLFEKLRVWRKEKGEEAGVPVYIVSTNAELTDIIKIMPKNYEELKRVKGFGKKKIEKYGGELLEIIKKFDKNE